MRARLIRVVRRAGSRFCTEDLLPLGLLKSLEFRFLFIVNAVTKLTNKNFLVSYSDLWKGKLDENRLGIIITELFLSRPRLNVHSTESPFHQYLDIIDDFMNKQRQYLNDFGVESF